MVDLVRCYSDVSARRSSAMPHPRRRRVSQYESKQSGFVIHPCQTTAFRSKRETHQHKSRSIKRKIEKGQRKTTFEPAAPDGGTSTIPGRHVVLTSRPGASCYPGCHLLPTFAPRGFPSTLTVAPTLPKPLVGFASTPPVDPLLPPYGHTTTSIHEFEYIFCIKNTPPPPTPFISLNTRYYMRCASYSAVPHPRVNSP